MTEKGRACREIKSSEWGWWRASRDITFQFPHSCQQESSSRAGTGSSPWKSLQWYFLKSQRKTSSSEGSSGVCPENPVAWNSLEGSSLAESLIGDETKSKEVPKAVSFYKNAICKNQYVINGKPDDVTEGDLGRGGCLRLMSYQSESPKTRIGSLNLQEKEEQSDELLLLPFTRERLAQGHTASNMSRFGNSNPALSF